MPPILPMAGTHPTPAKSPLHAYQIRSLSMVIEENELRIPVGNAVLDGFLGCPPDAGALILFVHGSGSSRFSPRNRFVAGHLNQAGLATLLFDLLTPEEESVDLRTAEYRFDIGLLARRLAAVTHWVDLRFPQKFAKIGYFGSSTGGAAALVAATDQPGKIGAVVCRGSRTDMAAGIIDKVDSPTLLIIGERDEQVLEWNCRSFEALTCEKELAIIPGATHLFEERGALQRVADLAAEWFSLHLKI